MASKSEPFDVRLDRLADRLPELINDDLPDILGQAAVDAFKQNFQDEGFFGSGWQEVKRRQGAAKGAAASRPILTGSTGNLRRSIQYEAKDGKVEAFSDLPYSAAHNEGTKKAGIKKNVTIPKRQFIGDHKELDYALEKEITDFLDEQIESIL